MRRGQRSGSIAVSAVSISVTDRIVRQSSRTKLSNDYPVELRATCLSFILYFLRIPTALAVQIKQSSVVTGPNAFSAHYHFAKEFRMTVRLMASSFYKNCHCVDHSLIDGFIGISISRNNSSATAIFRFLQRMRHFINLQKFGVGL